MREKMKKFQTRLAVLLVSAVMASLLLAGTVSAKTSIAWGHDCNGYYWVEVDENNRVLSDRYYYNTNWYVVRWGIEGDSTCTVGGSATIGLAGYGWDGKRIAPYGITYSSSDPSIAYIPNSASGTVVGKKPGTVTITASSPYGSATMRFTVTCNHQFDDGRLIEKPTCKSLGRIHYTCKICGYSYEQAIPTVEHDLEWVTRKATPETNGRYQQVCSMCGKTFESQIIYRPKKVVLSQKVFQYNGKTQRPDVTVKDAKGQEIPEEYYKVKYTRGSKEAGTYTVTVHFKGRYAGSLSADYKIK